MSLMERGVLRWRIKSSGCSWMLLGQHSSLESFCREEAPSGGQYEHLTYFSTRQTPFQITCHIISELCVLSTVMVLIFFFVTEAKALFIRVGYVKHQRWILKFFSVLTCVSWDSATCVHSIFVICVVTFIHFVCVYMCVCSWHWVTQYKVQLSNDSVMWQPCMNGSQEAVSWGLPTLCL